MNTDSKRKDNIVKRIIIGYILTLCIIFITLSFTYYYDSNPEYKVISVSLVLVITWSFIDARRTRRIKNDDKRRISKIDQILKQQKPDTSHGNKLKQ